LANRKRDIICSQEIKLANFAGNELRMISKRTIKNFLGDIPYSAELYWQLQQGGKPLNKAFSLKKIERALPDWRAQASEALKSNHTKHKRNVVLFSTLRYWIEHTTLMGMTLAGQGHAVTLLYLPYANWQKPLNKFDQRRQNTYAKNILENAKPMLQPISLLDLPSTPKQTIPDSLMTLIEEVSVRDTQYTMQVEEFDQNSNSEASQLYHFRLSRNLQAAKTILAWLDSLNRSQYPDIFIIPNGSILEMGSLFQAVRSRNIPVITYEFGEQRDRIWLSKNQEVMFQNTDSLWKTFEETPIDETQWNKIKSLFKSRQKANLFENFSRKWQGTPSQGGQLVREKLGLDNRPIILLAANVIGDSLTLGRQVFSRNMTEWLIYTVKYLAEIKEVQFIIRIHPGERFIEGPSVSELVKITINPIPQHIHLVEAEDTINTYDLVDIADLGLVYTTTVGLEMAMSGIPVIVVGKTHYRDRGFTFNPTSWDSYHKHLSEFINDPSSLSMTRFQVEQAWNYAYRFFFDYPSLFPWHLVGFWDDVEKWQIGRVLSDEGIELFSTTFDYLTGEPRKWAINSTEVKQNV
jgi:hypothetical protein